MRRVAVTPASGHDSRGLVPVLPARPGGVWADLAYDAQAIHDAIRRRAIRGARPGLHRPPRRRAERGFEIDRIGSAS